MSWEIRLRSSDKTVRLSIADTPETGAEWVQDAFVWTNVLRNRARWVNAPAALDALYSDAADQLLAWGFKLEELRSMAGALIVEIDLPDGSDPTALAIRAIPWEFLLRAVLVGKPQGGRSPVLIRHLAVSRKESPPPTPSKTAVFIQSAPGPLADLYDFDEERSLFEAAIAGRSYDFSKDPNLDDVEKIVTRLKPSVVHLTGFDARQGFAALQQTESQYPAEGMYLSSALGQPQVSGPGPLAQALTAKGKHRPSLVTLNLYNSCEIAAAIVSAGASAAIGFMAEFHDATAEVFFMKLYQAWASKLTAAAEDAIAEAVSYLLDDPVSSPHLEGAPIVIWSAQSVLNKFSKASARRSQREPGRTRPKRLTPAQVRNMLTPYLDYPQELNYCGLHNSANPFAKPARFGIRKIGLAPVPGLLVQVSISVGGEQSTFTKSIDIDVSNHEINDVTLSLASELVRALREKVQATMTVTLSYEGHKIFEDTKQVGLLATDEWQRTTPWLPSFILPRDPAVLEIVRWAHPVLSAICDSTEAGFDSYQRQTGAAGDEAKDRTIVDQQVRALWWTVKNRGRLRYLGAPPTYTKQAQRIRTPTAILKGRAGTCLDLALLFSACVAAIDVHAVVFVLKGHALPGYFRTPAGHADFERLMASYYTPRTGDLERSDLNRPWIMQPDGLERLIEQIRSGALVPLETVALTEHGGFEQAIDRGSRKLVTEVDNFEAMYDLTLARDHAVTPLPIAGLL